MADSDSDLSNAAWERNCRLQFSYTSQFCEENVHKMIAKFLLLKPRLLHPAISFYAVFVSSKSKQTPIWHQKAGIRDEPVLWDYHVILVAKGLSPVQIDELCHPAENVVSSDSNKSQIVLCSDGVNISSTIPQLNDRDQHLQSYVFDLDSNLSFPTTAVEYYHQAMRPELGIPIEHAQVFRVIPAEDFLNYFSSDR